MSQIKTAIETVESALREFGASTVVVTSFQREGVVIVDMVQKAAPGTPVLTIDTGRLPSATFEMIRAIEKRYAITVERIIPDPAEVASMVAFAGPDLFRDSYAQRMLCCQVRKVRPLDKAAGRRACILCRTAAGAERIARRY